MNIAKLITRDVFTCRIHDTLEAAARLMWDHDLGALPVVDDHARVVGMLTDRDICMAAYTRRAPLEAIAVRETMSPEPTTCAITAEVSEVEELMRAHQVHRIPVVDDGGRMVGIISINDLAQASQRRAEVNATELASTLAAVTAPRRRVLH